MPTRNEMWQRSNEQCDLLIIGGGINGAGIARDAAQRGLSVVLVEKDDLGFGTSSRSSKLVHGGLRYLEMMEFGLVFEAVSERRILLDLAPHLVNPLGFLFPVYASSRRGMATISAGLWVYEGLSLFRSPRRPRKLKLKDLEREEPALNREGLKGAPLYYDCSTDDARLTLENGIAAARDGATLLTYTEAVGYEHNEAGHITAVRVRDRLSGAERTLRTRVCVNATGPWTDRTIALDPNADTPPMLRPTKGVHIVVRRELLPVNNAVVCFHPEDQRILFVIPWGDATYVGTTDTDFDGDPSHVHATGEDVRYLLHAVDTYFPDAGLTPGDVHCTWAGLRPLVAPPSAKGDVDESAVSREHTLHVGRNGLITIAGGKLTTYRRMCAEVVDTAIKMLRLQGQLPAELHKGRTDESPLPGAIGWPADDNHDAVALQVREASGQRIDPDSALLLTNTYGMRALEIARLINSNPALGERLVEGRPELLAQVDFGVHEELACTVTDLLKQRTQLFYRDLDQGLSAIGSVGARMQQLLGWDDETRESMEQGYRAEVAASRQWRDDAPAPATP